MGQPAEFRQILGAERYTDKYERREYEDYYTHLEGRLLRMLPQVLPEALRDSAEVMDHITQLATASALREMMDPRSVANRYEFRQRIENLTQATPPDVRKDNMDFAEVIAAVGKDTIIDHGFSPDPKYSNFASLMFEDRPPVHSLEFARATGLMMNVGWNGILGFSFQFAEDLKMPDKPDYNKDYKKWVEADKQERVGIHAFTIEFATRLGFLGTEDSAEVALATRGTMLRHPQAPFNAFLVPDGGSNWSQFNGISIAHVRVEEHNRKLAVYFERSRR